MPYGPYPYFPAPPMQGTGYSNTNNYQSGTNTPPRSRSPTPVTKESLNYDSTRRTDAAMGTEKAERQNSVRLLRKNEEFSSQKLTENHQ